MRKLLYGVVRVGPPQQRVIDYYRRRESRVAYALLLGGTRHFGWYPPGSERVGMRTAMRLMEDRLGRALGLPAGARVLDAGCGRGNHSCELARRFGLRVVGIDPVESNLGAAREAAARLGVGGRVTFTKAGVESIPFGDASFDLVWCRDALAHVRRLREGLVECARVLRPGGHMLVFTTHATERMEPREAARICGALGVVPDNTSAAHVEGCFEAAGFQIVSREEIGGELAQYYEERDGRCARELMRLARMIQAKEKFVAVLGEENYEVTAALYHWVVYQLIGKLSSVVYTLRKAETN